MPSAYLLLRLLKSSHQRTVDLGVTCTETGVVEGLDLLAVPVLVTVNETVLSEPGSMSLPLHQELLAPPVAYTSGNGDAIDKTERPCQRLKVGSTAGAPR